MSRTASCFLAAAATALAAIACGPGDRQEVEALPDEIHGLTLVESHVGEEAAEILARMHDQGVAPTDSYVGYYGPEDMRATLYVSRFATEAEAGAELDAMVAGIGMGSSGYAHHRLLTVRGLDVHSVFGRAKVHFFWADGDAITWLASPPPLARAAVAQLLGVPVGEIPGLMESIPDTASVAAR